MDITFYDRTGRPIAYTSDGKHIFTFRGKAVAYVDKDSVYSYSGAHLGRFVDGWVRDNGGRCVFFTENARGGPAKPARAAKPAKAAKNVKPTKSVKQVRPARPAKSSTWSELSGPRFFLDDYWVM